jgi:hypothetical protein
MAVSPMDDAVRKESEARVARTVLGLPSEPPAYLHRIEHVDDLRADITRLVDAIKALTMVVAKNTDAHNSPRL